MRRWVCWKDWSDLVLGAWLFLSPWLVGLGAGAALAAGWNAWIVGVVAVGIALWVLARPEAYPAAEGLMAVAGAWLVVAPWLFGFSGLSAQAWNAWIVGALLVVLPLWRYATAHSRS